jgi:hypothetical protein
MRPRILVVILAVALAAVFVFWFLHRAHAPGGAPATSATPAPASTTASLASSQHSIQLDINHLGLTPDRARQLFSLTVGPLPGVSLDGLTRDPNEFDGTQAVVYLLHEWHGLTPDQRRAAAVLIYGSPRTRSGRSSALLPGAWAMRPPRVMIAGLGGSPTDDLPAHDYWSLAINANNAIAQQLGVTAVPHIVDVQMEGTLGTEFGHSTSWAEPHENDPNTGDLKRFPDGKCHTILWNSKFVALDDLSTAEILAHELTHCYQDGWAGTYANRAAQPHWVADGEANWVAATVVPSGQVIDKDWPLYVYAPKTVYSDRGNDAMGVFGHLSDISAASVVWSRLAPVAVVSQDGNDANTLSSLVEGVATSYYSTWGASYFQQTNYRWKITGPGHPPSSGPAPDDATINPGTDTAITALPYQATLTNVSGGSDILVVSLLTGYGRVHDQGWGIDTALDSSGPLALCLRDAGCKCDSDSEGHVIDTKPAKAPVAIGIDGGDAVALVGLSGHSLNEFCRKKPEKPAPPPGGGGGGGGGGGAPEPQDPGWNPGNGDSVGDPHLKTFDGFRFDFQRVGEYTLVRSTKDDFVVQVRQVPVPGSRAVSVNQSMATKIGGKRVTVTLDNGAAVLRIDGTVVTGDPPPLPGVSLTRAETSYGATYAFEWPDGTVVRAEQLSWYTINVRVRPSASRHGTLEGLLGNDDGSVGNDTGEPAALADKWRVAPAASLFDYLPGQSSETFVDPAFPDPSATVPNRDAAEKACREEGITDAQLLHDCIIDFGVTNGFLFASQYAHQQKVLEARASLAPKNVAAAAPPKEKVLMMAGTITDKTQPTQFTFDAQANDVIYMNQPDCVDRSETSVIFFALFDPAGKPIDTGHPGCELGRQVLPVAGTYTFKGNMAKNQTGKYSVPIRFLRHDRVKTIKYGDIVSGNIDQKAAHDLYSFTAKAGDLIQVSGKGCQLPDMFTGIVSAEGWDALGPGCRDGTVFKIPKDGTYQLLVNYGDRGPGTYQFVFQGVSGG